MWHLTLLKECFFFEYISALLVYVRLLKCFSSITTEFRTFSDTVFCKIHLDLVFYSISIKSIRHQPPFPNKWANYQQTGSTVDYQFLGTGGLQIRKRERVKENCQSFLLSWSVSGKLCLPFLFEWKIDRMRKSTKDERVSLFCRILTIGLELQDLSEGQRNC